MNIPEILPPLLNTLIWLMPLMLVMALMQTRLFKEKGDGSIFRRTGWENKSVPFLHISPSCYD